MKRKSRDVKGKGEGGKVVVPVVPEGNVQHVQNIRKKQHYLTKNKWLCAKAVNA